MEDTSIFKIFGQSAPVRFGTVIEVLDSPSRDPIGFGVVGSSPSRGGLTDLEDGPSPVFSPHRRWKYALSYSKFEVGMIMALQRENSKQEQLQKLRQRFQRRPLEDLREQIARGRSF